MRWDARHVPPEPTVPIPDLWRPDYQLLRDSPITRFAELGDLEAVGERLGSIGYQVITVDASSGNSRRLLAQANDQVHEWPPGYASTLDGFDDALGDLESTAVAFAIHNFDPLRTSDPLAAAAILDSLVHAAWSRLLDGHPLLGLIHSIEGLGPVGTFAATDWRGWWVKEDD